MNGPSPQAPGTPSRLPPLLQPWAAQLSLFPHDLALALGDLLLRLQPLVGPFVRRGLDAASEPGGVGDIARRGSYDRLLLSEWAVADAAPDEFLRRAAEGELLFTGPEPVRSTAPLRSVALFDAGPSQLGTPRLAHLALFVLLARRAELAGATFQWGVLQQPGVLHGTGGRAAIGELLEARDWASPQAAHAARWDETLDATVRDCWLIGDDSAPRPARVGAVAAVRETWNDALEVAIVGRGRSAQATLALPEARLGVRLLRRPFEDEAAHPLAIASGAISLKYPPLFGSLRNRVGVCMVDGGASLFHVPDAPGMKPGRSRKPGKIRHLDATVAAGVFPKALATVAVHDGKLVFLGFPGPYFSNHIVELPPPDVFHAVPGTVRWADAFHVLTRDEHGVFEHVTMLDKAGRLVCWGVVANAENGRIRHRTCTQLAGDVVGVVQQGKRLMYAVRTGERIDAWEIEGDAKRHMFPIMHGGDRFLFGEPREWRGGGHIYALRLAPMTWLVGLRSGASEVQVEKDAIVLGCARLDKKQPPGLVVLSRARGRIELVTDKSRTMLAASTEPIAQAAFDPEHQRIAWLQAKSGVLVVQRIGDEQPLLRTLPRGEAHDA